MTATVLCPARSPKGRECMRSYQHESSQHAALHSGQLVTWYDQPDPQRDVLRHRYVTAITDNVTIWQPDAEAAADAALAVRDRILEQLQAGRARWKAKAEEIEQDRDRIIAAVDSVLANWDSLRPGATQATLAAAIRPAHDGPTVAELAANDRNWDVEQDGE